MPFGGADIIMKNNAEVLYFCAAMAFKFDPMYWRRGQSIRLIEFFHAMSESNDIMVFCRIPFVAFIVYENFAQRQWDDGSREELEPLVSYMRKFQEVLEQEDCTYDQILAVDQQFFVALSRLCRALSWTNPPI